MYLYVYLWKTTKAAQKMILVAFPCLCLIGSQLLDTVRKSVLKVRLVTHPAIPQRLNMSGRQWIHSWQFLASILWGSASDYNQEDHPPDLGSS